VKTVLWKRISEDKDRLLISEFISDAIKYFDLKIKDKKILIILDNLNQINENTDTKILLIVKAIMNCVTQNDFKILILSKKQEIIRKLQSEKYDTITLENETYYQLVRINDDNINYNQINQSLLSKHYIPQTFKDADFIIPITLFDKSAVFGIHGILASLFNVLPSYSKNEILIKDNKNIAAKALMEIYSRFKEKILFSVILFDSSESFIALSDDPISVDAFSSALVGIRALSIKTTSIANKLNIGSGDILRINIVGDRFQKPLYLMGREFKTHLKINYKECNLCKLCIDKCPLSAIYFEKNQVMFNNKCNNCFLCIEICPNSSIQLC
jgi:NAD-dependent dihydropyrimidine dehydrogenase PreA subunit